jgi:hypothetical protein
MSQETRTQLKTYFQTGDTPTQGQFENLIDSMVNKTDDAVPYVYRVKMDQSASGAPSVTVLHNSFPSTTTFTWSYNAEGDYRMTANVATFLAAKTFISGGGLDPDNAAFSKAIRSSDTVIIMNSFDASTYPIETLRDDKMINVFFEVIVYP